MQGSVREWYRDQRLLITGGTGYLGKVLLEKILWSCPEVTTIYLLIRKKKTNSSQKRLQELFTSRAFDRLKRKYPERLKKVVAVSGDITEDGLGLSDEDGALLARDVNTIFHGAASVRFDDALGDIVNVNLRGTMSVLEFAKKITNLQCLLFVSTAYSNCDRKHIEETLYPSKMKWQDLLKISNKLDSATLAIMTDKVLGVMPNTYVFTKSIMEHMLCELGRELPIVICRPSVVYAGMKEPEPAWADNLNGIFGLSYASMTGVNNVGLYPRGISVNFIPCDYVSKALILAAAMSSKTSEVPFVNICCKEGISNEDNFRTMSVISSDQNTKLNIKPAAFFSTGSFFVFNVVCLYSMILPAIFVDSLLFLLGKKRLLLRIRRKLYSAWYTLSFFAFNDFQFGVSNCERLVSTLQPEDQEEFGFQLDQSPDLRTLGYPLVNIGQETTGKQLYQNLTKTRIIFNGLHYIDMGSIMLTYSTIAYLIFSFQLPQRIIDSLFWFFLDGFE